MPSFEYCAFNFWNQWQGYELPLYCAISATPTEQDVRKALNYFQVARTFKGLGKDGNAVYILDCLIQVRADSALSTPAAKVEKLADELSKKFSVNTSAASKLLWLSFRDPYLIYDTRAVNGLRRHFREKFDGYLQYSDAWRKAYKLHEAEIAKSIEKLPKARIFMRTAPPPDQEIFHTARETWFKERVFDTFLWEIGA
jgi:hypothetical protein